MHPDPQILDTLVQRIVEAVHPLRIILFGSAARDEMTENSDLDLLVVMPEGIHRRQTAQGLYRQLWGLGFAKDIIVATEGDLERYGSDPFMVFKAALEEGKELYHVSR